MEILFRQISTENVPLSSSQRFNQGQYQDDGAGDLSEIESLKIATSVQELLQTASIANARLRRLEIFDSVNITLDSGPPEFPGTTNVIVEVVETKNPLTGDIGIFSKPGVYFYNFSIYIAICVYTKFLLSSFVDKMVCLWQVGHHQCLRVYSHNNYVTCVEFNPVDDKFFISGSIDGKVHIWEVGRC